jgi:hypothetical protein
VRLVRQRHRGHIRLQAGGQAHRDQQRGGRRGQPPRTADPRDHPLGKITPPCVRGALAKPRHTAPDPPDPGRRLGNSRHRERRIQQHLTGRHLHGTIFGLKQFGDHRTIGADCPWPGWTGSQGHPTRPASKAGRGRGGRPGRLGGDQSRQASEMR